VRFRFPPIFRSQPERSLPSLAPLPASHAKCSGRTKDKILQSQDSPRLRLTGVGETGIGDGVRMNGGRVRPAETSKASHIHNSNNAHREGLSQRNPERKTWEREKEQEAGEEIQEKE